MVNDELGNQNEESMTIFRARPAFAGFQGGEGGVFLGAGFALFDTLKQSLKVPPVYEELY